MAKNEIKFKPGSYTCIIQEGGAFFNKRFYEYGDKVILDSQEMVDKLMSAGVRFIPTHEFDKNDGDVVRKIVSASRNNKTVEDVLRAADEEQKKLKAEYEAQIAELQAKLESKKEEK